MRRISSLFFALASILSLFCLSAAAANINVTIDMRRMESDVPPQLIDNTTYVPIRAFSESLSECNVTWEQNYGRATVTADGLVLQVVAGEKFLIANNRYLYLGKPAIIRNGRLLLPIRPIAKGFGAAVAWDGKSYTAVITRGSGMIAPGDSFYSESDVYWLSRIINAESDGEPLEGMIAVGNVVLNRVRSPDFPSNVYDVIFDRNYGVQFTPTADNRIYLTPSRSSIIAAKISLEGYAVVPSALYFLNEAKAASRWIIDNRSFVTAIGSHDFYA